MGFIRTIAAFLAAVLVTTGLATAASSLLQMQWLAEMGAAPTGDDYVRLIVQDLTGFGPTYAAFLTAALAVAFLIAWGLTKAKAPRLIAFAALGATGVAVLLVAVQIAVGVQPISAARTPLGFGLQVLSGAIGGLTYALLAAPRPRALEPAAAG